MSTCQRTWSMKSIWVKEKLKNPLHVHCWCIITSNLLWLACREMTHRSFGLGKWLTKRHVTYWWGNLRKFSIHQWCCTRGGITVRWRGKEIQLVDSTLSIIDIANGRYALSPKRKQKLRRTAAAFTQVYTTLKRIVETRYIKYSVVAGDALIKMFWILVAVCEDDWASTKDDAAQGLLRKIKKKNTIPDLMTLLDVLDHAVELSCCSQSEEF